jgi:shikimate 5-dehydrogenase
MGINREQLRGMQVLVLGAGGLARAVIVGLLDCGANITVFNRNRDRAELLVGELNSNRFNKADASGSVSIGSAEKLAAGGFGIVINCTPVGMAGGSAPSESPLPASFPLDENVTVFETVYTPARTPLVQEGEARGARVVFGADLFVKQAAMQFEKWTGAAAPVRLFQELLARPGVGA